MEKNMYRFVNALLFWAGCILCLNSKIGIGKATWVHFGVAIVALGICSTWCQVQFRGRIVLGLSLGVAFVMALTISGASQVINQFKNYIYGVIGSGGEAVIWGRMQECIQAAVLAVICFGICMISERIMALRLLTAVALFVCLLVDMFRERSLSHIGVVCVMLYVILIFVEWTEKVWEKERLESKRHYMYRILPFMLLYFGLMIWMPAPKDPYDWKFVKDFCSGVHEMFLQVSRNWVNGNREDFEFGSAGFGGGELLDHMEDGEQKVMYIQGQATLQTNVYLMGKIYDSFDGRTWESTDESTENERQLDTLETLYAIRCYDRAGEEKYVKRTGLHIWYEDFRTSYLFVPLKNIRVQDLDESDYFSLGGRYVFDEKKGYGLEYRTSYLQLNVDHPIFYEFLEQEGVLDEKEYAAVQNDYFRRGNLYSLEDLYAHRERMKEVYGQVTEVSPQVQEWMDEVTKDASTEIDKLKDIEAALQQMTYTTNPGALPEWVQSESDFLDYFILQSNQGYCVYYASAFVMLARAQGFPARYVEGFCVPVDGTYKVPVTSDMAHAWPEVYVEGVGWIPFEPTPGYAEIRYTPWVVQTVETKGEETFSNPETEEVVEEIEETEEAAELVDEEETKQSGFGKLFMIIGLTIAFAVCTAIIVLCLDILLRRRRVKRSNREERFQYEIAGNMRILAYLGYERMENETLAELQKRAWAILGEDEEEKQPAFVFLQLYEAYLYGRYPVEEDMVAIVLQEKQRLLLLLKKWNPLRYWYCKLRVL